MNTEARISAFTQLGSALRGLLDNSTSDAFVQQQAEGFDAAIGLAHVRNNWFIPEFSRAAIAAIGQSLEEASIRKWLEPYGDALGANAAPKQVAIIMAGNIPLVGFHDLLCVLMSGHTALAKTSADDSVLITFVIELLKKIEPGFAERIRIVEGKMEGMDAVIATGSNNTSRYFEHYFGKYPHIIRKNRTSVAVITGQESKEELEALGSDIFTYFGLGCRSVSKLYLPEDFKLDTLFEALYAHKHVIDNNKYGNNYDYNRAIWLMEREKFLENGFFMLKESTDIASPVAACYYERYTDANEVLDKLSANREQIQCIVSQNDVPFGQAQNPQLWDYADGVDTMAWLGGL